MKRIFTSSVAAISIIVGAGVAHAADYEAPSGHSWGGFYAGVHGGIAWADPSGIYDNGGGPGPFDFSSFDDVSGLLGGHLGYNHQIGQIVLGVEGDVSAVFDKNSETRDAGGPFTVQADVEHLASIRGRLGYAFDNLLVYGTGGWAHAGFGLTVNGPDQGQGPNGTITFDDSGFVFGGGLEYAMNAMVLRIEYLHYDIDKTRNIANNEINDADTGDFLRFNGIDVVRAGISLPF